MFVRVFALIVLLAFSTPVGAALLFQTGEGDDGLKFIVVSGEFEHTDDLKSFERLVRFRNTEVVSFDSTGGNIYKAMELGRLIRQYGLATIQLRKLDCASACALAFMGGELRFAEPGSIGVHKSSFAPSSPMNKQEAVSAVQEVTADIIGYMAEMGVSPSLLQLALSTEANDIRYLSGQVRSAVHLDSAPIGAFADHLRQLHFPAARECPRRAKRLCADRASRASENAHP